MTRMWFLPICLVFAVLLAGCASSSRHISGMKTTETEVTMRQRAQLIGTWRGEAPIRGGGVQRWTTHRTEDGLMRTDFEVIGADGSRFTQSETAMWGVSGGIYFTITTGFGNGREYEPADTRDPSYYDTYLILELDDERSEYRSLSTGDVYSARKDKRAGGTGI